MRLRVTTPTEVIADVDGVLSLRAEDATGAFGIQQGHADFVTVLPVSVVSWHDAEAEEFIALRGGVLHVHGGDQINIATRGAWREADLKALGPNALAELARADDAEDSARTYDHRLHLATIRQVERLLNLGRDIPESPPRLEPRSLRAEG